MTLLIVDASVMIKWVIDEEPLEDGAAARSIIGGFTVAAPRLVDFELASILWVKQRKGLLSREAAEAVALALQAAPVRRVDDDGLWLRTLSLSATINHSPYGCAYVVAGMLAKAEAVVTADRRFVRAFEGWRAPSYPSRPYVVPVTRLDLPPKGRAER